MNTTTGDTGPNSRRFLFAMWEGGGSVPPMLGVAKRLVRRGHRVRVLGDPTIRMQAEQVGCAFTPWRRAPHRTDLSPENDLIRDWETTNPIAMLRRYRDTFLVAPAPAYAADTLEALERETADVFVPDYVLFGAIMAAEKARVPTVALVPNIWPFPVRGAPPFGSGLAPAQGALGRARDALLYGLTHRLFQPALPRLNQIRRDLGLAPLASFFEQPLRARALLVLTSPSFDFCSRFVPPNVHYVGPVLDDPEWVEPWQPPWDPANRDPLVLVAFSTTFQDQGTALRRVVDALAPLRVRALLTRGEALASEEVASKGSVIVVRSAPHREVMARAALVVTHCGHGTTLKALAARVPIVCLPMGRDQDDTAARVVHRGAGVRLSPKASTRAIANAVERVLGDEKYRVMAGRLGDLIEQECSQIDAAVELERHAGIS